MTFRFQKASCVAVGTFNMYILHPQWLAKHQIIESDTEVELQTNLTRPGMRFVFPKEQVVWVVTPNRLVLESRDRHFNCGVGIARTLAMLPETPIFAVGSNVHCVADSSEWEHLSAAIRAGPPDIAPMPDQRIVQRTFHLAVIPRNHETVNLQIAWKQEQIELTCNVHKDVGNCQNPNKAAITAAEQFFEHLAECELLAQYYFGTKMQHGSDNT